MRKPQLSYVLIFILLALPPMSLAEEDTWTRKTDMPTRTWGLSTSVVNGKIYAIGGGSESASGQKFSTVEEYDPMMDAWTRKADMPTRRWGLSTSVVNGKIYAIGGSKENSQEALSNTEEYDPVANTWDVKADMPTPRSRIPTCVVDGKIYVIGGHDAHNGRSFANVEVYDPEIDEWTERSDMPTARGGLSTSVVDGKIYAMGGYIWEMGRIISVVEEYNPATDTWTTKAPMPRVRGGHSAVVVNGKIYLIGGNGELDFRGPKVAVVDVYDPATGTWTTKADLPTVRVYAGTSMVNGYIYVIGGSNYFSGVPSSGGALSTVEEYDTGLGIQVSSISPQEGPVTGGQDIAIIGRRLRSGLMVTIGGNPLRELNITDALITGITPPGTDGEQDILIFISDLDESVFVGTFFYNLPSSIVAIGITPTNGKQAGGDLGSINGSGFLPGALVAIGGVPATGIGVTPTIITFTIPSGTEGVKDVVVTNPDGQKAILRGGYTYNPFPVIERVEPRHGGPLKGGTEVTITGSHFMDGVEVTIGENRVQKLDLFSSTELRLKAPGSTAGPKTVKVTNPDGQEAMEEGFTYNPAPTVSSVEPNSGPLEGGRLITIIGTGFLTNYGADVLIGGAEASIERIESPTKITAKTPPSTPGVKDVVVVNRDGQKATLKDGFTYNPLPVITKVIPDNGKLAGGTNITIRGSGFLPGARVLISTETETYRAASSIQVVSPAIIMAVTPLGEPGPKDVAVLNPDRQIISLPEGFTYNPVPTITRITPDHGTSAGGTKLTIEGTGFLQGARVVVGERVGTTMVKDDETIEAVTPPNPPGILDVHVINPDTQKAVIREAFVSVGELVYNYPNPFLASEGTTFRYVTNQYVEVITVRIFNLRGVPIGIVRGTDSNEVRWHNPSVHVGLYVYLLEARIEGGKVRRFKNMLEVRK